MRKRILTLIMMTALLLSGCEDMTQEAPAVHPPSVYAAVADTYSVQTKGPDTYDASITAFHRGVICMPTGGGSFPLVLLMPDSSSADGFVYLAEKLARNGFISVILASGDEEDEQPSSAAVIADEQIQRLRAANDGDGTLFPIDFTGKINFSKVGLFGHGNRANDISEIALTQRTKGIPEPATLLAAPVWADGFEQERDSKGAISILIPSLSSDYNSNTFPPGISAQITQLKHANKNFFDSEMTDNDALETYDPDELTEQLSPKLQQTFLEHFALDFYNASLKGKTRDTLYAADTPAPTQMYGYDVLCRLTSTKEQLLADAFGDVPITLSNCTSDTLTIGTKDFRRRLLYQLSWETIDASFTFEPEDRDFRGRFVLSMRLRTDSANPLNGGLIGQSLTVVLKDGTGNSSAVTLSGCPPSLLIVPDTNENTLILSTDILLSEFQQIDLSDIASVELRFDQSNSGSVYWENITLR